MSLESGWTPPASPSEVIASGDGGELSESVDEETPLEHAAEHTHVPGVKRAARMRARIKQSRTGNTIYRTDVGFVGGVVLVVGVIAIPYPGPGWLIVFCGLGILATEFAWAARVLTFAKHHYDRWEAWVKRQNFWVQALVFLVTAAIVIVTLWLVDAYDIMAGWVGLDWGWVDSPIL